MSLMNKHCVEQKDASPSSSNVWQWRNYGSRRRGIGTAGVTGALAPAMLKPRGQAAINKNLADA